MDAGKFIDLLENLGDTFYTGVPDSLLSPFIDGVMERYNVSEKHIVAANEGAAVALAAGHYLATNKPAIVYMQNSGIGNAINPICSLMHEKVYSIPAIFVIGWRGEPDTKDEPQHVFQGEATLPLLDCLEIPYVVVSSDTTEINTKELKAHLDKGQSIAFVIRKDSLQSGKKMKYTSSAELSREDALKAILSNSDKDSIYVCTTGKLSREMFELREEACQGHGNDFLTVGSMGHSLMIAYGIALAKPEKQVFCLDGDGAILMHMGSLAVLGVHNPTNLVHIVINNGAHETVGGLPTVSTNLNFSNIAKTMGYTQSFRVSSSKELTETLKTMDNKCLTFIEVMCNLDSRSNLGRPTTTPVQNKNELMGQLVGFKV